MPKHQDIKANIDKDYVHGQETREAAAHDLVFTYITHWDDSTLETTPLAYRGEFDMIRGAVRDAKAELEKNPVQVDFESVDDEQEDAGETMDGVYRGSLRDNQSIEAFAVGRQEMTVCGNGAWEQYAEYETMRGGNTNQIVKRRPIHEANSCVFWDASSKMRDRSDALRCTYIKSYTKDSYAELYKELKDEEPPSGEETPRSITSPISDNAFTWVTGGGEFYYIADHYEREKVEATLYTFVSPFGEEKNVWDSTVSDIMEEMAENGYELVDEKEVERWQVTKFIVSGDDILDETIMPGEHIPIIQCFGTLQQIENQPYWEGIVRPAKHIQILTDFHQSYLADIVSRSPRSKAIYWPEQIAGHEEMHSEVGAENNYPYVLVNKSDANGADLPTMPIGQTPEPNIPPALLTSIELSRRAMQDVAGKSAPDTGIPSNISNKSVNALMARWKEQYIDLIEGYMHAVRYDGVVYASMASEIIDTPRKATIVLPDGTSKKIQIQEQVFDKETATMRTINDVYGVDFDVYSKIGIAYSSAKEQTRERFGELAQSLGPQDQLGRAMILGLVSLEDGDHFKDLREYAKKEMLIAGYREPETPEEEQMMAQLQQQQQPPSADMVLAQAEMLKGQAQNKEADIRMFVAQNTAQDNNAKRTVDGFNAETKRMDAQVDAKEAGANINYKRVDAFGKELDNQIKARELIKPENMTVDELYMQIVGG